MIASTSSRNKMKKDETERIVAPHGEFEGQELREAHGGPQTEQKVLVNSTEPKSKNTDNYFLVTSKCRVSLNLYKNDINIKTENTEPTSSTLPTGLLLLENENYSDLKNYFESKTNKLFISVTIKNQDILELKRTLNSILDNFNYLNSKIGFSLNDASIIIIADGIANLDTEFKQIFFKSEAAMKDPQPKPKEEVRDYLHCFRAVYSDAKYENPGIMKRLDVMFVIKETNAGIINSHLVFLNGFCNEFKKDKLEGVCALLTNAGTGIDPKAIKKCFTTMVAFPETSAISGQVEVNVDNVTVVSWVAGLYFDFKFCNDFEKHLEGFLGHASDLDNSFSFFKLKEVLSPEFSKNYFKNCQFDDKYDNPFDKTIKDYSGKYISDRLVLCQKSPNIVRFVPDAYASVNYGSEFIPKMASLEYEKVTDIGGYFHLRRRLYNSKLFSTINFMSLFCDIWKTQLSGLRKFAICILAIYHLIMQGIDYLMISFNYCFIFAILSQSFFYRPDATTWLMWIYLIIIGVFLILGLAHNNVRHFWTMYFILICILLAYYIMVVCLWGYSMFYMSNSIEYLYNDITNFNISPVMYTSNEADNFYKVYHKLDRPAIIGVVIINVIGYLCPIIFSLALHPMKFVKPFYFGFLSYFFVLPTFGGMQQIFSLSNCDDYDLNTANLNKEEEDERVSEYRKFKLINILVYIALNGIFIYLFATLNASISTKVTAVAGMVYFFTFFFLFKAFAATGNYFKFILCEKKTRKACSDQLKKSFIGDVNKKSEPIAKSNIDVAHIDFNTKTEFQAKVEIGGLQPSPSKDKKTSDKVPKVSVLNMMGDSELDLSSPSKSKKSPKKVTKKASRGINERIDGDEDEEILGGGIDLPKRDKVKYNSDEGEDEIPPTNKERISSGKIDLKIEVNTDIGGEHVEILEDMTRSPKRKKEDSYIEDVEKSRNSKQSKVSEKDHYNKYQFENNEDEFDHHSDKIENFSVKEDEIHAEIKGEAHIEVNDQYLDSQENEHFEVKQQTFSDFGIAAKKSGNLEDELDKVKMAAKIDMNLKASANFSIGGGKEAKVTGNLKASENWSSSGFEDRHEEKLLKEEEDDKRVTMGDVAEAEKHEGTEDDEALREKKIFDMGENPHD